MQSKEFLIVTIACAFAGVATQQALSQCSVPAERICDTDMQGPKACVCWVRPDPPLPGFHFTFNTADPNNPGVNLIEGRDALGLVDWSVWSEDDLGNPANLGPVAIHSTSMEDINVRIANHSGSTGAVNVVAINLGHPQAANLSKLWGNSGVTGSVNGAVFLQENSSGSGGDLRGSLVVLGSVTGPVTIPELAGDVAILGNVTNAVTIGDINAGASFDVSGNASDNITISGLIYPGGSMSVDGSFPANKTVHIADMQGDADDYSSVSFGAFAGTLFLGQGVRSNTGVLVASLTGAINLNNADVAGSLSLIEAGATAAVQNGGAISGSFYPAVSAGKVFSGTATFASVASTGKIHAYLEADLSGTITVTGSVAGDIVVSGSFLSAGSLNTGLITLSGEISIDEGASGDIVVGGHSNVAGAISIAGGLSSSGSVTVDGSLTGNVDIIGGLSGDFTVLGANIARSFDVAGGMSGTISGTHQLRAPLTISGGMTATALVWHAGRFDHPGRLTVNGLCDGDIVFGTETEPGTTIQLHDGLGSSGSILVNDSLGAYDANGTISIPGTVIGTECPNLPVVFDGCIRVFEGLAGGGSLYGAIWVRGCHSISTPLNICVDGGDGHGNITITQGCSPDCPVMLYPPPGWSCNPSTCP